jgi:Eukaryotic aspartyl protease
LISQQGNPTVVESLASAQLILGAVTSYKIPRLADGKNDGEITFGGLDPTKFDPSTLVTLDNVSPSGFWEANIDSVTVNGTDLGLTGRSGILDTGTTLIIAPPADAAAVHAAIPGSQSDGQGGYTIPCTTTASVALSFGGTSFAIDVRDIIIQPIDPSQPNGQCISGISSGSVGTATEWLVCFFYLAWDVSGWSVDHGVCRLAMCS